MTPRSTLVLQSGQSSERSCKSPEDYHLFMMIMMILIKIISIELTYCDDRYDAGGFFLPFAVTGTAILLSGCLVLFITDVSWGKVHLDISLSGYCHGDNIIIILYPYCFSSLWMYNIPYHRYELDNSSIAI